jgi:hypothetical protein
MGLGRLSQGNKKPARGIPFNLKQLRKDLCISVDKKLEDVVQSTESENDCS